MYIIWTEFYAIASRVLLTIPGGMALSIPILFLQLFNKVITVKYKNGYMYLDNWRTTRKESLENLFCEGNFRLALIDRYRFWTFTKFKTKKGAKEYLVLNKTNSNSEEKFNKVFYNLKFRT